MKFTIKNNELSSINDIEILEFPKYTTQIMNLANQNAQGTRSNVVGQLSDIFPEYMESNSEISIEDWEQYYLKKYPDALSTATDKVYSQINNLKNAISLIDKDMVASWVKDLVINKTFNGMYIQKAILSKLASIKNETFRLATPTEESQGIDGFVGSTAYSIKPDTYKHMDQLNEEIDITMIFYKKKKSGLSIEVIE